MPWQQFHVASWLPLVAQPPSGLNKASLWPQQGLPQKPPDMCPGAPSAYRRLRTFSRCIWPCIWPSLMIFPTQVLQELRAILPKPPRLRVLHCRIHRVILLIDHVLCLNLAFKAAMGAQPLEASFSFFVFCFLCFFLFLLLRQILAAHRCRARYAG